MAKYSFNVIDRTGKSTKKIVEANSEDAAKSKLRNEGYSVTGTGKEVGNGGGAGLFKKKVKLQDLSVFCKQFAAVLRAGVTVIAALEMMAEQMDNKTLQTAIKDAQIHVQKGGSLSDALKLHPDVFPAILYNMVAAGETSGKLEVCFERCAVQFEKDGKLQGKIKGAMTYPIVVLVVIGIVVVIMLVSVIPTFEQMFAEMGADLPMATKMLVGLSNFLLHRGWLAALILIGVIFGIKTFNKTPTGQEFTGSMALKLPIFGNLNLKSAAATFSRTFATLLASGIPLIDAVEQTAKVIKNKIIRDKLMDCKIQVAKGVPLSKPIRDQEIFPPMLSQMMHIGEETGNIEDMMSKVADFYEEEVDRIADNLTTLMEPLIMVVMATIVGFIVMAIYGPIMSMYSAVDSV